MQLCLRFQQIDTFNLITESRDKLVPEGIEGQVPYIGSVHNVIYQLVGGLRASMGYTGCKNLNDFQTKTKFIKITTSLNESHTHDVIGYERSA